VTAIFIVNRPVIISGIMGNILVMVPPWFVNLCIQNHYICGIDVVIRIVRRISGGIYPITIVQVYVFMCPDIVINLNIRQIIILNLFYPLIWRGPRRRNYFAPHYGSSAFRHIYSTCTALQK
jgi:hypothetical protein